MVVFIAQINTFAIILPWKITVLYNSMNVSKFERFHSVIKTFLINKNIQILNLDGNH